MAKTLTPENTTEPVPSFDPFAPENTAPQQPKTRKSTALRSASEVEAALRRRYDGPIDQIDGFSYIPWHESVDLANEVFGYFGWSSTVVSCDYTECDLDVDLPVKGPDGRTLYENGRPVKQPVHMFFKGFKSIVRVTVQVWDEGLEQIITTHHDGVGYGPIQGQGMKNPMDGATKTGKSDGISTAIKHYGNAFGLFLYEKENKQATTSTTTTQPSTGTSTYTASTGGRSLSEKQVNILTEKLGITADVVRALPFDKAKAGIDALFSKTPPWEVAKTLGIEYVKKTDRLPIPVG